MPRSSISLFCVWLLLASVTSVHATITEQQTFGRAYKDADVVVLATLERAKPQFSNRAACGTKYTANLERIFKGNSEITSQRLLFGRASGLKVGGTYLLFLRDARSVESEFNLIKSLHPELPETSPSRSTRDLIACDDVVPGLLFDSEFAWPVRDNKAYVFGIWEPRDVPPGVRFSNSGPNWLLNAHDLFKYLDGLKHR